MAHPAQLMISPSTIPTGATLIGYIDRHPADSCGLGYAVLRMAAGHETAWDGSAIRSLPRNWRDKVAFTPCGADGLTRDQVDALADDHEEAMYEDRGEAAFGRPD